MEIDDIVSVARECAKSIHGKDARVNVEEMSEAYPAERRFRASVRVRGVNVDAQHRPTHGEAAKALARELSSRSRAALESHRATDFRASVLGL